MKPWIKTYITDAPWRSILLFAPFFAVFMVFLQSRSNPDFYGGKWKSELALWSVAGLAIGYSTWRAEGSLERKNARWKEKKQQTKNKN
ncbi:hypothetical protein FUA23_00500 [Neolewinella aurantiaca]|uniref:Uncharacterized protein n=1 Tax=Neolewinella aurantiaca TaxID=2602767 RepID=A0A5C7FK30_9BACT|nr:hypothetical protein [Neolewinella aurantiaca]TXF91698.1 hypothetical protein FUA23_00500 [Neolewinella aurantiaca]